MYNRLIFFSFIYLQNLLFCSVDQFDQHTAEDITFGYIAYSTTNIGDDIQAIAAKQFLPKTNNIPINRELVSSFSNRNKIPTIINGWFMHTKDICWWWSGNPLQKSWPPSLDIDPILISIHFTPKFLPITLSQEGIKYLKQHSPIGARDIDTLKKLQEKNIPSYFSGCLTLTLNSSFPEREEVIYAVDINSDCLRALEKYTRCKIVQLTHGVPLTEFNATNYAERLLYAEKILDKYQKAKCVVTERLHAALPCLAFETPVLLIAGSDSRFGGLKELVRSCSKQEFINGNFDFDFDNPRENPKDYIPIREKLINIMQDWVASKK